MCKNWQKKCKMADFEKVHTVHERWTAQWPAVPVCTHACMLADFGTGQSHAGLGAWPVAFDVRLSQMHLGS